MDKINSSSTLQFVKTQTRSTADESGTPSWAPNTDLYACDEGLVIKVELAGIRREDLELVVENNRVRISGQRPDGCRSANCKFLVMEISYGTFETVIELPNGYDVGRATAAYNNGFLRIAVPKEGAIGSRAGGCDPK